MPVRCDTELSSVGACDLCSYTTNNFLFCYPLLQPHEIIVLRSILPSGYVGNTDYDWRFKFNVDSCMGTNISVQILDALTYYRKLSNLSYSYYKPVLGVTYDLNCSHYNNSYDNYGVFVDRQNYGIMVFQCSSTVFCATTLMVHNATLVNYNSVSSETDLCGFRNMVNHCSTLLVAPLLYLFV